MIKDASCNQLLRKWMSSDIADVGIGALIVFIAMVLVAGIAASVLIQTSSKLENQAMTSGQETIAETSTGLAVEAIEGYNQSGSIQLLAVELRARAGSKPINLADTVIELTNSSKKNLLTYNASVFTDLSDINGQLFTWSFYPYNNGTTFGIIILQDADGSCTAQNPAMGPGDHIVIAINVSKVFDGIGTNVKVYGLIIPEEGSPGIISFTTPGAYTDAVVELS